MIPLLLLKFVCGVPLRDFLSLNQTLAGFGCFTTPFCYLRDLNASFDCRERIDTPSDPIACDSAGNVVALTLPNQGLSGTIASEIGLLTRLAVLQIGANTLRGSLPVQLGQLRQLRVLIVSNNYLEGVVPFIDAKFSQCILETTDVEPSNCFSNCLKNCTCFPCPTLSTTNTTRTLTLPSSSSSSTSKTLSSSSSSSSLLATPSSASSSSSSSSSPSSSSSGSVSSITEPTTSFTLSGNATASSETARLAIMVGVAVGVLLLVAMVIVSLVVVCRRRRRTTSTSTTTTTTSNAVAVKEERIYENAMQVLHGGKHDEYNKGGIATFVVGSQQVSTPYGRFQSPPPGDEYMQGNFETLSANGKKSSNDD